MHSTCHAPRLRRRAAYFAARAILLLLTVVASYGQVNTATITGTATDPAGAPIPNVRVIVVQTQTNFESTAVTNLEGLYRVQSLQPGPYRVTFEAAGFKRTVQSGLDLNVGDVAPVNVHLEIGQVTESIQVSAQATAFREDHRRSDHGVLRGPAADEPDAAAELVDEV